MQIENGGSKNIEAVKSSYHELKGLDFTVEQIVQIALHGGGSKNIEAVKSSYHELKGLDFTAEQIVQNQRMGARKTLRPSNRPITNSRDLTLPPSKSCKLLSLMGARKTLRPSNRPITNSRNLTLPPSNRDCFK